MANPLALFSVHGSTRHTETEKKPCELIEHVCALLELPDEWEIVATPGTYAFIAQSLNVRQAKQDNREQRAVDEANKQSNPPPRRQPRRFEKYLYRIHAIEKLYGNGGTLDGRHKTLNQRVYQALCEAPDATQCGDVLRPISLVYIVLQPPVEQVDMGGIFTIHTAIEGQRLIVTDRELFKKAFKAIQSNEESVKKETEKFLRVEAQRHLLQYHLDIINAGKRLGMQFRFIYNSEPGT